MSRFSRLNRTGRASLRELTVVEGRHFRGLWRSATLHVATSAAQCEGVVSFNPDANAVRWCHVYVASHRPPPSTGCRGCIHLSSQIADLPLRAIDRVLFRDTSWMNSVHGVAPAEIVKTAGSMNCLLSSCIQECMPEI